MCISGDATVAEEGGRLTALILFVVFGLQEVTRQITRRQSHAE
jgi:hypothetical protein